MRTLNIAVLAIMAVVSFSSVSHADWRDKLEGAKEAAKVGVEGAKTGVEAYKAAKESEEDPTSLPNFWTSHNPVQVVLGYYWDGGLMLMAMFGFIFLLKSLGKRKDLLNWILSSIIFYILLLRPIVFITEYGMQDQMSNGLTPVGYASIVAMVVLLGIKYKFVIGLIRSIKNRVFTRFWKGKINVDDVTPQPGPTPDPGPEFEKCPNPECQKMAFVHGRCRVCGYRPPEQPETPSPAAANTPEARSAFRKKSVRMC